MALSAAEHRQAQAAKKASRNAGAHSLRGSWSHKAANVSLIASEVDGTPVLIAITAAEPGRAMVLRQVDGLWRCGCFAALHSVSRTCAHEKAANEPRD